MDGSRRREVGRQLASKGDGVNGPSYADVRWLADVVEQEHNVRIQFQVCPGHVARRWAYGLFWVRAQCVRPPDAPGDEVWAGAAWGGNAGARTMPAAMVAALLAADEKLTALNDMWGTSA